jgi:hypothetical protein
MKANLPSVRTMGVGAAAVCALLGFAHAAIGQTSLRGARDISGFWQDYPFGFSFDPTVNPGEPQRVSLQPEYDARYKAFLAAKAKNEAEGKPQVDTLTQCMPDGMPDTMMAFFPMEIVVSKKTVFVIPEGVDPLRRIYMDGRHIPPPDDLNPTYEGFSVGRWEGNTLVVDTAGLKSITRIADVPHSDELRVNERIRLLDDDTLEDVLTFTDPKAFLAPWIIKKTYKDYNTVTTMTRGGVKGQDPGKYPNHKDAELEVNEFVCNENNRNLPGPDGVVGLKLGDK